jgi:mannose-6-phosphate isomerase-like protein (cupin superfamily)
MDEAGLTAQLRRLFSSLRLGGRAERYPDHTHRTVTAHIILNGEMTLSMAGQTKTYHAGERCDVPANAVHSAIMGPRGCRYLIGER